MIKYFAIFALIALSFGCATHRENISNDLNSRKEVICQRLKNELIPFPQTTAFDSDLKKREAYLTGFCKAWEYVVSGNALHATVGFTIPLGFEEPWNAGWSAGYKIASDCWMVELNTLSK